MRKQEFLDALESRLSGLSERAIRERLEFYNEMINDRVEDGFSEEDAVARLGTVDEIADEIISDYPLAKLAREKLQRKNKPAAWKAWTLWLTSVVWIPLLIALFAVIISLYAAVWSVIATFWASFAAFVVAAPGGVVLGFIYMFADGVFKGFAFIGAGTATAGLAILAFFGCIHATKGCAWASRKIPIAIKKLLMK